MTDRLSVTLQEVSVRRGEHWALKDISLTLKAGERWALIGGNGAGKTQLMKLISADVWPTPTGREARTYRVGRRRVDLIDAKQRIAYVGAELQDKYARYDWNLAVRDVLATGLQRSDLLQRAVLPREGRLIEAMLARCGLLELAERRFLSLSYGQKRLTLLGRALIQAPDWLLLDEFYNGLDQQYRARIDGILALALAEGQSWLISAHRAMDVPRGTRKLIELRAGKVRDIRPLVASDLEALAAGAQETSDTGEPVGRPLARGVSAKQLIRLKAVDLYVEYQLVLQALNWELRAGQHWAVFGANGAGKSSFLKLLYGDLSPALGGRIARAGFPRGTPIADWKRQVGLVSPELQTDYAVNVSVFELVASGRYNSIGLNDPPTAADRRDAAYWLKFFKLASVAHRQPRQLSYGQLRRALFARALTGDKRILLLDEPLTGLDPRQRATMKGMLEALMARGVTLIMAVHHAEDLPRGVTHALRLHKQQGHVTEFKSAT
jgi:molybdate transport system ATP-binding protein